MTSKLIGATVAEPHVRGREGGERLPEGRMSQERTAKLEGLRERAVSPENWEAALTSIERNNGAPGPNRMKAKELREPLRVQKTLGRYEFILPSDLG